MFHGLLRPRLAIKLVAFTVLLSFISVAYSVYTTITLNSQHYCDRVVEHEYVDLKDETENRAWLLFGKLQEFATAIDSIAKMATETPTPELTVGEQAEKLAQKWEKRSDFALLLPISESPQNQSVLPSIWEQRGTELREKLNFETSERGRKVELLRLGDSVYYVIGHQIAGRMFWGILDLTKLLSTFDNSPRHLSYLYEDNTTNWLLTPVPIENEPEDSPLSSTVIGKLVAEKLLGLADRPGWYRAMANIEHELEQRHYFYSISSEILTHQSQTPEKPESDQEKLEREKLEREEFEKDIVALNQQLADALREHEQVDRASEFPARTGMARIALARDIHCFRLRAGNVEELEWLKNWVSEQLSRECEVLHAEKQRQGIATKKYAANPVTWNDTRCDLAILNAVRLPLDIRDVNGRGLVLVQGVSDQELQADVRGEMKIPLLKSLLFPVLLTAFLALLGTGTLTSQLTKVSGIAARLDANLPQEEWTRITATLKQALRAPSRRDELGDLCSGMLRLINQVEIREQELGEAHGLLSSMFQGAIDGIITFDTSGTILSCNQASERIFGYKAVELCKQHFRMLHPPETAGKLEHFLNVYEESPRNELEGFTEKLPAIRSDGTQIIVEVSVSTIKNAAGGTQFVAFIRDVTQRERLREEILQQKDDLEQKSSQLAWVNEQLAEQKANLDVAVEQRTAQLREARDSLEQRNVDLRDAIEWKVHGLRQIVHELRGPLTLIKSSLDAVVRSDVESEVVERMRVPKARRAVDDMVHILSTLRDVRTLDTGGFRPQYTELNLADISQRLAGKFEDQATRAKVDVQLNFAPDATVLEGDADGVEQVLLNLMSNAIKYAKQDGSGRVRITTESLAPNDAWPDGGIRLEVCDNGIGISEEDRDHIFQEFFRSKSAKNHAPGLGLGLVLCKRFVEAHRGAIGFDSRFGEGTCFWIELPKSGFLSFDEGESQALQELADVLGDGVVLCGARQDKVERMVAELLKACRTQNFFEKNAAKIVELTYQFKPTLVILHGLLEEGTGRETALKIRELVGCESIPVILVGIMSRKQAERSPVWIDDPRVDYLHQDDLQKPDVLLDIVRGLLAPDIG